MTPHMTFVLQLLILDGSHVACDPYSVHDQALETEQAEAEAKHRLYTLLFERTRSVRSDMLCHDTCMQQPCDRAS